MIGFVFRLVTGILALLVIGLTAGLGFLWYDGSRIIGRAEASGWLTPKPNDAPLTVFETTASKAMFGPTWNETGLPCRTAARFGLHYASKPDRRGLSISQVVARDMNYDVEATQSLTSQMRQLSVACLLEGKHNDTELLRLWLRRANFGAGLTGIDAASEAVFNRAPSLLTQDEAAKLIALIYRPELQGQPDQWSQRADAITQRAAAD